jgi:hypothetical protein
LNALNSNPFIEGQKSLKSSPYFKNLLNFGSILKLEAKNGRLNSLAIIIGQKTKAQITFFKYLRDFFDTVIFFILFSPCTKFNTKKYAGMSSE